MRKPAQKKSLFATPELDERFVRAAEKIAHAFGVHNPLNIDGHPTAVNFAELLTLQLRNISTSIQNHGDC